MCETSRYLKLEGWARRRYTIDGVLILDRCGMPSTYSRIESAAFQKYIVRARARRGIEELERAERRHLERTP